ncbi:MAG: hypothetical protein ACYCYO_19900 [Bacilli bacterium]
MQETDMNSNQFLRSFVTGVVHKSFARAIRYIGLPDFPRQVFAREIKPYLHLTENGDLEERKSIVKLWRSTLQGEVIATDIREDVPVFYVRAGLGATGYVMRLILIKGNWHIDSVVSVYERRFIHMPWFRRAVIASAVTAAIVLGLFIHQPIAQPGVLVESAAKPVAKEPLTHVAANHGASAHSGNSRVKVHVQKTVSVFRFHLAPGMPLGNLSQFLYQQHLVSNAVAFDMLLKNTGIDKDVQPGTYIFKKGMKVSQILQELKQGPPAP